MHAAIAVFESTVVERFEHVRSRYLCTRHKVGEKATCLFSETRWETDFVAREYGTPSQGKILRAYVCKDGAMTMRKPGEKPEMKRLKGVVHKQPGNDGTPPYR